MSVLVLLLAACRVDAQDPHAGRSPPPAGEHAGHTETPAGGEHAGMAMPGIATPGDEHAGHVVVAPDVATALGVRTVPARAGEAAPTRRAPATSSFDPTRTTRVTLIAGGQVRELRVPRVGERVAKGQVIARAWLPEVAAAAEELRLARDLGEPWVSAAEGRLRALGAEGASADGTWTLRSPVSGLVVSRPVREGGWLGAGGLVAEVASAEARVVELVTADPPATGTPVTLTDGTATWQAKVTESLPTAGAAGRSVRLAVQGDPPVGAPLTATWTGEPAQGVWVPRGAVVDTGERQVVFVASDGGYAPRPVKLGVRTSDEVQVLSGLTAGEEVVAAGTFLFDSETQMTGGGHAGMDM